MDRNVIIEAKDVEKIYGYGHSALKVLKGVSFDIKKGEVVSIVGPSGAGKSTLLNLMGCLDGFQHGKLNILDRDVSHLNVEELSSFRGRHIGFIFQLHNLLPEFTAVENLMIPLLIRREKKRAAREKAMHFLERFNLAARAHHKPPELSGGECQRVAVARAIIGEPEIILADEPTGSLDSANSQNLTEILLQLGKERNTTIVIVTHDMSIAARTERTISIIDGRIMEPSDEPVSGAGTEWQI